MTTTHSNETCPMCGWPDSDWNRRASYRDFINSIPFMEKGAADCLASGPDERFRQQAEGILRDIQIHRAHPLPEPNNEIMDFRVWLP